MSIEFKPDGRVGGELMNWWLMLQENKSDRASLRRASSVTEILLLPAFHRSHARFKQYFINESNWEIQLAMLIGVLAHVRQHSDQNLALQMSGKPKPAVSELRFRRLLQTERSDLFITMVRIVRLLGCKVNIYSLANTIYYWGDKVKQDLAFEYYPNAPTK